MNCCLVCSQPWGTHLVLQVEAGEWERVNKALRQHGLPVVELAHPSKAESKSGQSHRLTEVVFKEKLLLLVFA